MDFDRKLVEVHLQIYEDLYAKLAELGNIEHHVNLALEKYLGGVRAGWIQRRELFEEYWGE